MEAYIVAGYRTAVAKAKRGGFRFYRPDDLAIDVIKGLMATVPQLEAKRVDDVIVGNAVPEAEQCGVRSPLKNRGQRRRGDRAEPGTQQGEPQQRRDGVRSRQLTPMTNRRNSEQAERARKAPHRRRIGIPATTRYTSSASAASR